MNSHFASPDRTPKEILIKEKELILIHPQIKNVIDSLPYITLLLDKNRQIVYGNSILNELKGLSNADELLGLRPGEAIGCIHAAEEESGCGTSKSCQYCGAVNTILHSQKSGKTEKGEIQLTYADGLKIRAMDLAINASPVTVGDQVFTLISLIDISGQKRWHMLEKLFFHDLMNKMGSLKGFIELINRKKNAEEMEGINSLMMMLGDEILDEIKAQHNIILAENNELSIQLQSISIPELIDGCIKQMLRHLVAAHKSIDFINNFGDFTAETDPVLLKRVIINLLKNALEAIPDKEKVTVTCKKHSDSVEISVANPGSIPDNVQMQLFVRSFSTKGDNRGLGTYSIKMLTEDYLKGNVVFESDMKNGTIFRIYIKTAFPTGSDQQGR